MEVQTDLNMETIFRYELSLNPYAGAVGVRTPMHGADGRSPRQGKNASGKSNLARQLEGNSSSNQNRTTIEGGTYRRSPTNGNAEHSDFGQMYRASEEFPNSFI